MSFAAAPLLLKGLDFALFDILPRRAPRYGLGAWFAGFIGAESCAAVVAFVAVGPLPAKGVNFSRLEVFSRVCSQSPTPPLAFFQFILHGPAVQCREEGQFRYRVLVQDGQGPV